MTACIDTAHKWRKSQSKEFSYCHVFPYYTPHFSLNHQPLIPLQGQKWSRKRNTMNRMIWKGIQRRVSMRKPLYRAKFLRSLHMWRQRTWSIRTLWFRANFRWSLQRRGRTRTPQIRYIFYKSYRGEKEQGNHRSVQTFNISCRVEEGGEHQNAEQFFYKAWIGEEGQGHHTEELIFEEVCRYAGRIE